MNDICESCVNRLKTDICKDCRYATESYYEPIEMNFSEAYKKFSEGKTIRRIGKNSFWNKHNCTNDVFKSEDFLADDWTVFDDEMILIKKSDYEVLDANLHQLNSLKNYIANLIRNEIPELRDGTISYICNLVLSHSTIAGIRKELKRK